MRTFHPQASSGDGCANCVFCFGDPLPFNSERDPTTSTTPRSHLTKTRGQRKRKTRLKSAKFLRKCFCKLICGHQRHEVTWGAQTPERTFYHLVFANLVRGARWLQARQLKTLYHVFSGLRLVKMFFGHLSITLTCSKVVLSFGLNAV